MKYLVLVLSVLLGFSIQACDLFTEGLPPQPLCSTSQWSYSDGVVSDNPVDCFCNAMYQPVPSLRLQGNVIQALGNQTADLRIVLQDRLIFSSCEQEGEYVIPSYSWLSDGHFDFYALDQGSVVIPENQFPILIPGEFARLSITNCSGDTIYTGKHSEFEVHAEEFITHNCGEGTFVHQVPVIDVHDDNLAICPVMPF